MKRQGAFGRLARTVATAPLRLPHAAAALTQGAAFIVLTLGFAALLGVLVGWVGGYSNPRLALLWGVGVGTALLPNGFASAVSEPVHPGEFLEWWFHSTCLGELAIAMATALGFLLTRVTALHPAICAAIATVFGLPASFGILGNLFRVEQALEDSIVRGEPLTPFEEVLEQANLLGRMRRPPVTQTKASARRSAWARFRKRVSDAREAFYDRA